MTCTNCRKPIAGAAHDHTGTRTVNGTVNRTRTVRVVYCAPCEQRIATDIKAAQDRHARELRELAERLGVTISPHSIDKLP